MREHENGRRRPLREVVSSIDRDILHLLLRRNTFLNSMRGKRGYLQSAEEKYLRQAWQSEVVRVSSDPRLSTQFFTLMQEITFLPRSTDENMELTRRPAFNLAPARKPVNISLYLPADKWQTLAWLTLAASSGQPLELGASSQPNSLRDSANILKAFGLQIVRKEDGDLALASNAPLKRVDLSLHVGEDLDLFHLWVGQYLVRSSRVRFTGHGNLKLVDLTPLAHFLPTLNARLAPVVPTTMAFPVRLECTGVLPEQVQIPADLSAGFVAGLILALPFAEHPVTIDFSAHSQKDTIENLVLPLLKKAGAKLEELKSGELFITPCALQIPKMPQVPVDTDLAYFVLALPLILGGEAHLSGIWPENFVHNSVCSAFAKLGLHCQMISDNAKPLLTAVMEKKNVQWKENILTEVCTILAEQEFLPLSAALSATYVLSGGKFAFPVGKQEEILTEFFAATGLDLQDDGSLQYKMRDAKNSDFGWNAPSAQWSLALALAACARPNNSAGFRLGNPGLVTDFWPEFWNMYNALPEVSLQEKSNTVTPKTTRRRILTNIVAELPPEEREE